MITIVIGTNRKNSVSKQIAKHYEDILHDLGATTHVIDLMDLPEDFIVSALYEKSGSNDNFNPIRDHMTTAQKFVFIAPEYNGSFPGVLKAFIDGLKFPGGFKNKKCALVGISSGIQGGSLALSHLTDIFNYCGMHVLADKVKLFRIEGRMEDGQLTDKLSLDLLRAQAASIISF